MSSNEKLAIAAHLHVLLRRKTGRVTDTEWMACNPAYAQEVIRLAHEKAAEGGHDDLGLLADRLEAAMAFPDRPVHRPLAQRVSDAAREHQSRAQMATRTPVPPDPRNDPRNAPRGGDSAFGDSQMAGDASPRPAAPNAPRYVKGLR